MSCFCLQSLSWVIWMLPSKHPQVPVIKVGAEWSNLVYFRLVAKVQTSSTKIIASTLVVSNIWTPLPLLSNKSLIAHSTPLPPPPPSSYILHFLLRIKSKKANYNLHGKEKKFNTNNVKKTISWIYLHVLWVCKASILWRLGKKIYSNTNGFLHIKVLKYDKKVW